MYVSQETLSPSRQAKEEEPCQDAAGGDRGNGACQGKESVLCSRAQLAYLWYTQFQERACHFLRTRALPSLDFQGKKKTSSL